MSFNRPTFNTDNIQSLPDEPDISSSALKKKFDDGTIDIKAYLEGLIDQLESNVSGADGASNIGYNGNVPAQNIKEAIDAIYGIPGGIIPPATKTAIGGVKVGSGLDITADGVLSVSGAITPLPITLFTSAAGNEQINLTWIDPNDVEYQGVFLVKWEKTVIRRKTGGYPADINDGDLVVENTIRNQYQNTPYEDLNLINGTQYFYRAFTVSTNEAVDDDTSQQTSATPTDIYDGIMQEFFAIPAKGTSGNDSAVRLKVQKPIDANGVEIRWKLSEWLDTDTKSDGTLLIDITDDSNYYGNNKWYETDATLTYDTEYFFKAFPYKVGVYNEAFSVNIAKCKAGGLIAEYTFDDVVGTTVYDTSGNGYHGTATNLLYRSGAVGNEGYLPDNPSSDSKLLLPSSVVSACNTIDRTILFFMRIDKSAVSHGVAYFPIDFDNVNGMTNGRCVMYLDQIEDRWNFRTRGQVELYGVSQRVGTRDFFAGRSNSTTQRCRINDEAEVSATASNFYTGGNASPALFNSPAGNQAMIGSIDQFRWYNRALEDYEIEAIYNGGAGC